MEARTFSKESISYPLVHNYKNKFRTSCFEMFFLLSRNNVDFLVQKPSSKSVLLDDWNTGPTMGHCNTVKNKS